MLRPQLQKQRTFQTPGFLLHKPFLHGNGAANLLPTTRSQTAPPTRQKKVGGRSARLNKIEAIAKIFSDVDTSTVSVTAVVTVQLTVGGTLSSLVGLERGVDDIKETLGKALLLEFVSAELDKKTGKEKPTIKKYLRRTSLPIPLDGDKITYEAEFKVPEDFGLVGAVIVENEHLEEMYIKDIVLDGFSSGSVNINCDSWVHSKYDNKVNRVFFANKSYLPSKTPSGLKKLREQELVNLQGNGKGERKSYDRIYDYDVYNDLGDPDSNSDLARPVLGGKEHPYPRRCRTGRSSTKSDPLSERRTFPMPYVPRDEAFSELKNVTFSAKTVYSVIHGLVPGLQAAIVDKELGFPYFTSIDELFNEGINVPPLKQGLRTLLPRLVKDVKDTGQSVVRFETPEAMDRDKFFWFRDEEFSRQTLAGLNPYTIQLVTEWPLKSKLDPAIYGPQESAITTELIEKEIKGFMTVEEALKQKKLFMLDYHDLLLPYVLKVTELKDSVLYATRTLFFLAPDGTLKPLAIELTRPPVDGKPQWKEVHTPSWNATDCWLWRLAKAHVLANDSGYHQLVSHWLRTHCCTEPYIIATNRQLSAMHPIYRLLHPHFRYTMEINALARQLLINAGGIIETTFTPGKYCMELCSDAYDKQWRFDLQALPADLISRGMAVEDPTAPYGVKLTIEDYPFANDGLVLWDTLKQWFTDYVNHYYPEPSLVQSDKELQAWWAEIRTLGHPDKKDEPWWPELNTPEDLIHIITTIAWVTSGHHAAVNFGQYIYGGYFPSRPTMSRIKMPTEDPSEETWKNFLKKPEGALLSCFPTQVQAITVMAILDVLSSHSPDEEYLGEKMEAAWGDEQIVRAAFERFSGKLKELEGIVDARNANEDLRNRTGAGIVPYELLKPFSESGVTGKGVPYSISI